MLFRDLVIKELLSDDRDGRFESPASTSKCDRFPASLEFLRVFTVLLGRPVLFWPKMRASCAGCV
jgi:hypothetical protein